MDGEGDPVGLEAPGQPVRGTEYRVREIRLYGEYGVLPSLTLYGSSAFKSARLLEPLLIVPPRVIPEAQHETTGLGDVYLGGRVRLRGGQVPLSAASEVKIPSGYSIDANPSLGNGEADVTFRALAGAAGRWMYATADAGWTHRGGAYRDAVTSSIEIGGRLLGDYTWRGVFRGAHSLGGPSQPSGDALFDPATTSPRWLTLDFVLGAEVFTGIVLEAGLSHVLTGRDTLTGNTLEAALVWFN